MEQTWRWFGPEDNITLAAVRQAGATGIVTALHQIPYGVVWSLPVHETIKLGEGDLEPLFENYRESMRNLARCGVTTICYNFMPVLDWTRTELAHPLPGGGTALRFNAHEYAAFDCFMLQRDGAQDDVAPDVLIRARAWL